MFRKPEAQPYNVNKVFKSALNVLWDWNWCSFHGIGSNQDSGVSRTKLTHEYLFLKEIRNKWHFHKTPRPNYKAKQITPKLVYSKLYGVAPRPCVYKTKVEFLVLATHVK